MIKLLSFVLMLLFNDISVSAETDHHQTTQQAIEGLQKLKPEICNWFETAPTVTKHAQRRWIRYDKKIKRWFFKTCKFGKP